MFAILENGSVETMLRYRLRFSTGRAFAIPTGQSKTRMTVMTLRSCARTFISGATMSIIESLVVLERLIPRGNQSVTSRANGRRASFVERRLCDSPVNSPPPCSETPLTRKMGFLGPSLHYCSTGFAQLNYLALEKWRAGQAAYFSRLK